MDLAISKRMAFLSFCFLCVMVQPLPAQEPMQAPEGIPPESDWMYRQHYDQVLELMKTPDLQQRAQKLETFMKKLHPKSKILQYMEGFFGQIVGEMAQAGQNAAAQALRQKMGQLFPDSIGAKAQAFKQAYDAKDYVQAIKLGEEVYAKTQDQQVLVMLAQSYINTNNVSKAVDYSSKVVDALGAQKGIYYAAWLAHHYRTQGNVAMSARYYSQILRAYPSQPPTGWDAKAWTDLKGTAFAINASDAYVKKDYKSAIRNYEESLKHLSGNDSAYLFIGLSQWKLEEYDLAMKAFAKATVLQKQSSAKAREYLEQIYKARNNDSLEGLDLLLKQARTELGI